MVSVHIMTKSTDRQISSTLADLSLSGCAGQGAGERLHWCIAGVQSLVEISQLNWLLIEGNDLRVGWIFVLWIKLLGTFHREALGFRDRPILNHPIMQYSTGKHCVYYHRYHLVWSTKYRFKVLQGPLRLRVRDICRQVCAQNGVEIIKGVLSSDHVHMFVSVPPKLAISDLMRLMKGRSSHKIQQDFPQIKKRYWGRHFWGRGYFSTTNGAITEDIVLQYLEQHIANPTDDSR